MGHIRDRWRDPSRAGKNPGGRYQVFVNVGGAEKYAGAFRTMGIARRVLVEQEDSAQRGRWVDPTDQTIVVDLVRAFATSRPHKPRTAERAQSFIRNHVEPTPFGARRASVVRPSEAQAWVTDRSRVMAPRTLRILVTLVRGAFNAAVQDRIVSVNPFAGVTLPRVERERVVPLTVAQVAALVEAIGPRYRAMVTTQAGLGLRIGELLALRTQDVDWLGRTVRVEHQIDRLTRERVEPKTLTSRRTIPLPDMAAWALSRHIAEHPPAPDGLLFHTREGRAIDHDWYGSKVLVPAARRAGLPDGTTSHDLRHHYASVLLAAGESVVAVAERLGHDNASLVISTYGHLLPDSEDRTRRAVDAAWSAQNSHDRDPATTQGVPG